MKHYTMFIGMDVHKDSIDIATAGQDRDDEVRFWGRIGGDISSLDKVVRKFESKDCRLCFVYEAGPCGYEIYRYLTSKGLECSVVAPSMIPKRPGERIKTDRRDAVNLVRLFRAGELVPVYVPNREDEAVRDLVRTRKDARKALMTARQQLKAFLLRNGIRYPGRTSWTVAHMRWLSGIAMSHEAQQIVLQEYINAVQAATLRVDRITREISRHVELWRMKPVVDALQALRGVQLLTAATIAAEVGDMNRFDNPRQLMSYLGLVPSEHSSGSSIKRGSITKTGNINARTALVEAAWQYRLPARVSRDILPRHEKISKTVIEISWKAQLRLCYRYRYLRARGKTPQKIVVSIARELAGFMWAIAREVQINA